MYKQAFDVTQVADRSRDISKKFTLYSLCHANDENFQSDSTNFSVIIHRLE